jgi:hypothetical protein
MSTHIHDRHRDASGHSTPPSGQDKLEDRTHALRAGKSGPTQRKSVQPKESPTRGEGRDDHRSGSDSHRGRH